MFERGLPLVVGFFRQRGAECTLLAQATITPPPTSTTMASFPAILHGYWAMSRRALFTYPLHTPMCHSTTTLNLQQQNAKDIITSCHPSSPYILARPLSQGSHIWIPTRLHCPPSSCPFPCSHTCFLMQSHPPPRGSSALPRTSSPLSQHHHTTTLHLVTSPNVSPTSRVI